MFGRFDLDNLCSIVPDINPRIAVAEQGNVVTIFSAPRGFVYSLTLTKVQGRSLDWRVSEVRCGNNTPQAPPIPSKREYLAMLRSIGQRFGEKIGRTPSDDFQSLNVQERLASSGRSIFNSRQDDGLSQLPEIPSGILSGAQSAFPELFSRISFNMICSLNLNPLPDPIVDDSSDHVWLSLEDIASMFRAEGELGKAWLLGLPRGLPHPTLPSDWYSYKPVDQKAAITLMKKEVESSSVKGPIEGMIWSYVAKADVEQGETDEWSWGLETEPEPEYVHYMCGPISRCMNAGLKKKSDGGKLKRFAATLEGIPEHDDAKPLEKTAEHQSPVSSAELELLRPFHPLEVIITSPPWTQSVSREPSAAVIDSPKDVADVSDWISKTSACFTGVRMFLSNLKPCDSMSYVPDIETGDYFAH